MSGDPLLLRLWLLPINLPVLTTSRSTALDCIIADRSGSATFANIKSRGSRSASSPGPWASSSAWYHALEPTQNTLSKNQSTNKQTDKSLVFRLTLESHWDKGVEGQTAMPKRDDEPEDTRYPIKVRDATDAPKGERSAASPLGAPLRRFERPLPSVGRLRPSALDASPALPTQCPCLARAAWVGCLSLSRSAQPLTPRGPVFAAGFAPSASNFKQRVICTGRVKNIVHLLSRKPSPDMRPSRLALIRPPARERRFYTCISQTDEKNVTKRGKDCSKFSSCFLLEFNLCFGLFLFVSFCLLLLFSVWLWILLVFFRLFCARSFWMSIRGPNWWWPIIWMQ